MPTPIGTWYDADWQYRFAVTLPHTVSPSGTNDASVVIPKNHPIWAVLASEGNENSIRVCASDGFSALTFELADAALTGSWSTANKDGGIKIDDVPFLESVSPGFVCVYYGNSGANSGAGSVTLSSAVTGYVYQLLPRFPGDVIDAAPSAPGATLAGPDVALTSGESRRYWVRLNRMLGDRPVLVENSLGLDSVWGVVASAETGGGAAAIDDATKTRYVEGPDGSFYASVYVSGATDGTDYVEILLLHTGQDTSDVNNGADQVLDTRFRIRCNDPDES